MQYDAIITSLFEPNQEKIAENGKFPLIFNYISSSENIQHIQETTKYYDFLGYKKINFIINKLFIECAHTCTLQYASKADKNMQNYQKAIWMT